MADIISSDGLGLLDSFRTGANRANGLAQDGTRIAVNSTDGNLVIQNGDELLTGTGLDTAILRTYNSRGQFDDANGDGFRFSFEEWLTVSGAAGPAADVEITRTAGDGNVSLYTFKETVNGTHFYQDTDGSDRYDLISFDGATYKLIDPHTQVQLVFEAAVANGYRLAERVEPNFNNANQINSVKYHYEANTDRLTWITDDGTRALRFLYSGNNLTNIADGVLTAAHVTPDSQPAGTFAIAQTQSGQQRGNVISYTYDNFNRLSTVVHQVRLDDGDASTSETFQTTYTYMSDGQIDNALDRRIQTITQLNGHRNETTTATFTYDASDEQKVTSITYGGLEEIEILYDDVGVDNTQARIRYHNTDGSWDQYVVFTQPHSVTGKLIRTSSPIDQHTGDQLEIIQVYDENRNLIERSERHVYHVETTPGNFTETGRIHGPGIYYGYDTNGNISHQWNGLSEGVITYEYNDKNKLVKQSEWLVAQSGMHLPNFTPTGNSNDSRVSHYIYDTNGTDLRFVVGPDGSVVEHRHGSNADNNTGIADATLMYTKNRYTVSQTDPTLTDLVNWAANILPLALDSVQRVDRSFNLMGFLESETVYTATDASGNGMGTARVTSYSFDPRNGALNAVIDANGLHTINGVDQWGQATLSKLDTDPNVAEASNERLIYNLWAAGRDGSTVAFSNAANSTHSHERYNTAGLLIQRFQSTGVSAPGDTDNSHVSNAYFVYDGQGRILAEHVKVQDPDMFLAPSVNIYNDLGHLVAVVSGEGDVVEYSYSPGGQLLETRQYATQIADMTAFSNAYLTFNATTGVLDSVDGSLTLQSLISNNYLVENSSHDRISYSVYDRGGRLRFSIDAEKYVTEAKYNGAGQLVEQITYASAYNALPANWNTLDADGKLTELASFIVAEAGNTENRSLQNEYDSAGRLHKQIDGEGYVAQFDYNSAGQLVKTTQFAVVGGATSASGDLESYRIYDTSGQLIAEIDAEQYLTTWRYRDNGQIEQETRFDSKVDGGINNVNPESMQLNSLTVGGITFATAMADNNLYRSTRYGYNSINDLIFELDQGGVFTEYTYDAMGQVATIHRGKVDTDGSLDPSVGDSETAMRLISKSSYDELGRIKNTENGLSVAEGDVDGTYDKTLFKYDLAGRLVSSSDFENNSVDNNSNAHRTTYYYYDSDDKLRFTVNALGEIIETSYQLNGDFTGLGESVESIVYANEVNLVGSFPVDAGGVVLSGGLLTAEIESYFATFKDVANDRRTITQNDIRGLARYIKDPTSAAIGGSRASQFIQYNAFGEASILSQAIDRANTALYVNERRDSVYDYDRRGLLESVTVTGFTADDITGITTASASLTTSIGYDAFGRAVSQTDANGNVSTREYDRLGRIVSITDPLGFQSSTTYDAFGRVLTQTDARGFVTTYSYDDIARTLTTSINLSGGETITTETTYNEHGEIVRVIDGELHATEYQYDVNGNLVRTRVFNSVGDVLPVSETTSVYDTRNLMLRSTDANGIETKYEYDALSRSIKIIDDFGGVDEVYSSTSFDHTANSLTRTNAKLVDTVTYFDNNGRVSRIVEDPNGIALLTQFTYDADGLQLTEARGTFIGGVENIGYNVVYQYDSLGRRIAEIVDPGVNGLNLSTQYTYDENANVVTRTNANGEVTYFAYNARNEQVFTIDPLGYVSEIRYDANGRVTDQLSYRDSVADALIPWVNSGSVPTAGEVVGLLNQQSSSSIVAVIEQNETSGFVEQTIDLSHYSSVINDNDLAINVSADFVAPSGTNVRWVVEFLGVDGHPVTDAVWGDVIAGDSNLQSIPVQSIQVPLATHSVSITYLAFQPSLGKGGAWPASSDINVQFSDIQVTVAEGQLLEKADGDTPLSPEWIGSGWATGTAAGETSLQGTILQGTPSSSVSQTVSLDVPVEDIDAGLASVSLAGNYLIASGHYVRWTVEFQNAEGNYLWFNFGSNNNGNGSWQALEAHTYAVPVGTRNIKVHYQAWVTPLGKGTTNASSDVEVHLDDLSVSLQSQVSAHAPLVRHERSAYDDLGRRVSQAVDPNGLALTTRYVYDANGNVIESIDAEQNSTIFAYDARNQLVFTIDPLGFVSEINYDPDGQIIAQSVYADSIENYLSFWQNTYVGMIPNASDIVSILVSSNQYTSNYITRAEYIYDNLGRQRFVINASGYVTESRYDDHGNLERTIAYDIAPTLTGTEDLAGIIAAVDLIDDALKDQLTIYNYDNANRLYYRINPDGSLNQNVYDTAGFLIGENHWATGEVGRQTRHYYDAAGRRLYTVDPLGYVTQFNYDSIGNTLGSVRYEQAISVNSLTTTDQVALLINANSKDQQFDTVRDDAGRIIYEIDGEGFVTEFRYDALDRIIEAISYPTALDRVSLGASPTIATIVGLLPSNPSLSVSIDTTDDGVNRNTVFSWDETLLPGSASVLFRYGSVGSAATTEVVPTLNVASGLYEVSIADLVAGDYFYEILYLDTNSEVLYRSVSMSTVPSGAGSSADTLLSIHRDWDARQITSFEFDAAGRLLRESNYSLSGERGTEYHYDGLGNETSVVEARGVALAESDSEWALEQRYELGYTIYDSGSFRARLASELNTQQKAALKVLYTSTQQFDEAGQKESASNALAKQTQTFYDALGNITKVIDANGGVGYFYYDSLSQLRFSIDPTGHVTEQVYDAFGNRTTTIRYDGQVRLKPGADTDLSLYQLQVLGVEPAMGAEPDLYLVTNDDDQTTTAEYDRSNRKTKVTDDLQYSESFTYTGFGDLKTHTDKRGYVTTYDYDITGRQTDQEHTIEKAILAPDGVTVITAAETVITHVELDAFGNTTQLIEAFGKAEQRVTSYFYDNNNRVIQTDLPSVQMASEVQSPETIAFTGISQDISYTTSTVTGWKGAQIPFFQVDWSSLTGMGGFSSFRLTYSDGSEVSLTSVDTYSEYYYFHPVQLFGTNQFGEQLIAQFNGSTVWGAPILHLANLDSSAVNVKIDVWPTTNPTAITTHTRTVTNQQIDVGFSYDAAGDYEFAGFLLDQDGSFIKEFSGAFNISNAQLSLTNINDATIINAVATIPQTFRSYDSSGNVVAETDAKGHNTYHYYDVLNRRIATVDAERYLHEYFYDAVGNLLGEKHYESKVDINFDLERARPIASNLEGITDYRETQYAYDAANQVIETKTSAVYVYDSVNGGRQESFVTIHEYDSVGNVVVITHPNNTKRFAYYDGNNNLIAEVDPEGYFKAYRYDANNNLTEQIYYANKLAPSEIASLSSSSDPHLLEADVASHFDAKDRRTEYDYDGLNRLVGERLQGISYTTFNASGVRQDTLGSQQITSYEYDEIGNVDAVVDGNGIRIETTYDGLSRQKSESSPFFANHAGVQVRESTEWSYDALGNVLSETRLGYNNSAANQVTSFSYDQAGNVVLATDAEGGTKNYYYDKNGNVVRQLEQRRDANNDLPSIITQYSYDAFNRLVSTQDARSFLKTQEYNAYGELVSRGVADNQGNAVGDAEFFYYDSVGRLVVTNQEDGVERAYLYDSQGNVTAEIMSVVDQSVSALSLKDIPIDIIATLEESASITRKEYVYNANNLRVQTIEASHTISRLDVDPNNSVVVWEPVLDDPFSGGSISSIPLQQGSVTNYFYTRGKFNFFADYSVSFPEITGLGDGSLRLDLGEYYPDSDAYAGYDATSIGGSGVVDLDQLGGINAALYKTTSYGDILLTDFSDAVMVYQQPNTLAPDLYGTFNFSLGGKIRITGQPNTATALNIKLWQGDLNSVPATGVNVTQVTAIDADGLANAIPGWFEFDVSGYADGTYNYQYEASDSSGVISTVRGEIVIGAGATVLSQELRTLQPGVTGGTEQTLQILTSTDYNAFGEIISETDGRQYSNQIEYDNRGNVTRKTDAETNVTLEDGSRDIRHAPVTEYYYDRGGRAIAVQDAISIQYHDLYNDLEYYTRNEFNEAGYLTKEIYADGGEREYGFDEFGNRRWQDNELDIRTSFEFNKLNQLTRMNLPTDASFDNVDRHEEYLYDFQGRRTARRNANDEWESFYYDDVGRVIAHVDYQGIVTNYGYAFNVATGGYTKTTSFADGRSMVDVSDYFGRAVNHTDLGGRVYTYQYNAAGWLINQQSDFGVTASDPGQSIDYAYYNNGLVKEITDNTIGTRSDFEYDENGNRTRERYATLDPVNPIYYQWSEASYDEHNRLVSVNDTAPNSNYEIDYDFDANGNRMYLHASYYQPSDTNRTNGVQDTQEYWYRYDSLNRFVITKGVLDGNVIKSGALGYEITYNEASQRISQQRKANDGTLLAREAYLYNVGGLLTQTYVDSDPTGGSNIVYEANRKKYDANGNLLEYQEREGNYTTWIDGDYSWPGITWSNIRQDITTYSAGNRRESNAYTSYNSNGSVERTITTTYNYDDAGNLLWSRDENPGENIITTHYGYIYWDSAKQAKIVKHGEVLSYNADGPWKEGFSQFIYNANGHLEQVTDHQYDHDNNGSPEGRSLKYTLDQEGKILRRQELIGAASAAEREQRYYYFNGIGIGDAGTFGNSEIDYGTHLANAAAARGQNGGGYHVNAVSSADFEYNFKPINDTYPATTPGTYAVAQTGELLSTIALQLWGDASLWYLLADANGLQGGVDPGLIEGQTLVVPNVVTNIHNNSSTFTPYDPAALQGNVQPTLPDAPPPATDGPSCGQIFLIIIVVIVAIVVSYVTYNALDGLVWPFVAGLIAGAASAAASQGLSVAFGLQDSFDWKAVAIGAAAGAVGGAFNGLGDAIGIAQRSLEVRAAFQAVSAITQNFVSQGISVALGQQKSINWVGVAASGVAAGVGVGVDQGLANSLNIDLANAAQASAFSFSNVARHTITALSRDVIQQTISISLEGGSIDWASTAANAIGNGLGSTITNNLSYRKAKSDFESQFVDLEEQVTVKQAVPTTDAEPREEAVVATAEVENLQRAAVAAGQPGTGSAEERALVLAPTNNTQTIGLDSLSEATLESAQLSQMGSEEGEKLLSLPEHPGPDASEGQLATYRALLEDYEIYNAVLDDNVLRAAIRDPEYTGGIQERRALVNKEVVVQFFDGIVSDIRGLLGDFGRVGIQRAEFFSSALANFEQNAADFLDGYSILPGVADFLREDASIHRQNIPGLQSIGSDFDANAPSFTNDLLNTLEFAEGVIGNSERLKLFTEFAGQYVETLPIVERQALYKSAGLAVVGGAFSAVRTVRSASRLMVRLDAAPNNVNRLGRIDGSYSAIQPGPLADNIAETFSGGRYQVVTLENDTVLYRAGTADQPLGQFFSLDPPSGVIQTRVDKAVLPVWPGGARSPIDTAFEVKIPRGAQVYVGEVGAQGGPFVGGTEQIVVLKPWAIDGVEILNASPLR